MAMQEIWSGVSMIGALMVLVAFVLTTRRGGARGTVVDEVLNVGGSAILLVYALALREWAFVLLNGVWFGWSAWLLARALIRKR